MLGTLQISIVIIIYANALALNHQYVSKVPLNLCLKNKESFSSLTDQ